MEKIFTIIGALVVVFAVVAVGSIIGAYPTKWIVNYLFTPQVLMSLFGVSQLTFWKALWLNFICSALFKASSTSSTKK